MNDHFIAVTMLLLIVGSMLTLLLAGENLTHPKKILYAAIVFALFFFAGMMNYHLCRAGQAVMQWWVPGFCAAAITLMVRKLNVLGLSVAILLASVFLLSSQFNRLVHSQGFTGGARAEFFYQNERRNMQIRSVKHEVQVILDDTQISSAQDLLHTQSYPAGVMEIVLKEFIEKHDLQELAWNVNTSRPVRLWHSWLTGIFYREERTGQLRLWYPGGALAEAISGIEYR